MPYKSFYVYIITNQHHTVLYTGFTDDLERRIREHKNKVHKGFAARYNCHKLVYYEDFNNPDDALHRERQIKRYKRVWKINLIESMNKEWEDLYKRFA